MAGWISLLKKIQIQFLIYASRFILNGNHIPPSIPWLRGTTGELFIINNQGRGHINQKNGSEVQVGVMNKVNKQHILWYHHNICSILRHMSTCLGFLDCWVFSTTHSKWEQLKSTNGNYIFLSEKASSKKSSYSAFLWHGIITKRDNPIKLPQCRVIEGFWGILAAKLYNRN